MSGFFGVVSKKNCISDLFYGTDYHSHLGTRRAGLAIHGPLGFASRIRDISNSQFRSKFLTDAAELSGTMGIGVISDYEDQPLVISSHLGQFAIATVSVIRNTEALVRSVFDNRRTHFSIMGDGEVNPTELIATLINNGDTFAQGIRIAQESVEGSCTLLLLAPDGLYAARDRYGRTPLVLGSKRTDDDGVAIAAASESCALPNLGYETFRELGPGEIVRIVPGGEVETLRPADADSRVCTFLWIYYGFPASAYEGVGVEESRYASGRLLAGHDRADADFVTGVPDSGTGHALGYAHASGLPYCRPFVKYTPTWSRSFMPPNQSLRDRIAHMKLIPIPSLLKDKRILFCDDSIVRGTQLRDTARILYGYGVRELHARIACPPLLFGCPFLNFSRSRGTLELIARRVILEMTGRDDDETAQRFADPDAPEYAEMVRRIGRQLNLTSLAYQRIDDCLAAIGIPPGHLCTYCWTGRDGHGCGGHCPGCAASASPTA